MQATPRSRSKPRTAATRSRSVESSTSSGSRAKAGSASAPRPRDSGVRRSPHLGIPVLMADKSTAERPARDLQENVRVLVERGQQGDRAALAELYLLHFDGSHTYLPMIVGNRQDPEDR